MDDRIEFRIAFYNLQSQRWYSGIILRRLNWEAIQFYMNRANISPYEIARISAPDGETRYYGPGGHQLDDAQIIE